MSDPKGPKVDVPDELAQELEGSTDAPRPADESTGAETESEPEPDPAAEAAAFQDQYLRVAAEFENFKRRSAKERQDLLNYGNESLVKELLSTVDNLERALGHGQASEEGSDPKSILAGVELTHRALLQVLGKFGVSAVSAAGEAFDPQLHEAVGQLPSTEHAAGTIVDVLQKGYLLRDRLVRPALVVVSSKPEDSADD